MGLIGNLLWFTLGGGFLIGTLWVLCGLLYCLTIIGIPFGIACFRIAAFAYFPFDKVLVPAETVGEKPGFGSPVGNLVWFIFAGLWIALSCVFLGILQCLTIFGIPFGLANFKIAEAAIAPLGKRIVPSDSV